jgi:hypothetical protein
MHSYWLATATAALVGLLMGGGSVHAQGPTLPAQRSLLVEGTAWIDATPAPYQTPIQALIDGAVCGETSVALSTGGLPLVFILDVAPRTEKRGCGADGATIAFTIDGKPAHETLRWDSAAVANHEDKFIDLSTGETFAAYSGPMSIQGKPVTDFRFPDGTGLGDPIVVDAFVMRSPVESHVCGQVTVGEGGESTAWPGSYRYLIVPSASLKPGCGEEGQQVGFRIAGAVVAETKWTLGFHQLALETNGPIVRVSPNPPPGNPSPEPLAPNVGESEPPNAPWHTISKWLLLSGLLATSAAFGLTMLSRRKKA